MSGPAHAALQPVAIHDIRQNLFSACFSSDRDGWVVGELGRIFHTSDGGKSFTRADTGTRTAFLAIACLPDGSVASQRAALPTSPFRVRSSRTR